MLYLGERNDQFNHYIGLTVGDSSGRFLSNNKISPYSNSWIGGPKGYLWIALRSKKKIIAVPGIIESTRGDSIRPILAFWTDKDVLLNWYYGGLSPPQPRIIVLLIGPEQWHIWKIPAALECFANLLGTAKALNPKTIPLCIIVQPGMSGPWIKANWKWSNKRWQEWTSTF